MISLNYRDSRPIYEQIKDGLRKLIVTSALAADDKLPSVRSLATQLSINPNTIQRAYNELESEGYITEDRYIRAFVHDKAAYDGWTARKISMALARKGLDAQRVQAAIDEGIDSDQQMALLEACLRRALSKGRADEDPRKATARAIRAAAAKGFAPADIYRMLRTMTAETPDDD